VKDDGELIEEDIARKLLLLSADVKEPSGQAQNDVTQEKEAEKINILTANVADRNGDFLKMKWIS
jgi:hypothetical protein